MKKKIAILLPSLESGGVFQHALTIAESLINYSDTFEYLIVHYKSEDPAPFLNLQSKQVQFIPIPDQSISFLRKILNFLGLISGIRIFLLKNLFSSLKNIKIDLIVLSAPFSYDLPLEIPHLVFIPDLMHKYYPNFPEYGLEERLTRDVVYKYYSKNSVLSVVDSEQGVEDLYKFFDIKKEKIRIIPHQPASYVYIYKDMDAKVIAETLKKYNLPEKFLFYPAQPWYHKNHLRLFQALALIKEKYNTEIPIVLTGAIGGSFQKNYRFLQNFAKKLKVKNQIIHLGYVNGKEIVALYKTALALVFPTLAGPTNIPPLEAMVLGTPVLCSNLFEMPKQIGDAGLLFNPLNTEDIAEKIYTIWTDENLRKELIQKSLEKTKNLTLENYAKKWGQVIDEALK